MTLCIPIKNSDGKVIEKVSKGFVLQRAPKPIGIKSISSQAKTLSKGNAFDRATTRLLKHFQAESAELTNVQILEMNDIERGEQSHLDINPTVRKSAGLDVHFQSSSMKTATTHNNVSMLKRKDTSAPQNPYEERPKFTLADMNPHEVHRLTGFADLTDLLSFTLIVCGGSVDLMQMTVTRLTWLEEWLYYFTYMYGRLHTRCEDYTVTWGLSDKTLKKAFQSKLKMVKNARERWPKFASLEEDEDLRKNHWDEMISVPSHYLETV